MRLLITGASGFIGRHLISRLSARHEVYALVRNPSQTLSGEGVYSIVMNLAHTLDSRALPDRIDVIIHLAQANVPFPDAANELFAVNTSATQQLLNYGRRSLARRFLLASSGDVYGNRTGPCKETDDLAPADFYGLTKYASELLVYSYRDYLEPCVLRLFKPYGEGQMNRLIPRLADSIRKGKRVRLNKNDRPFMTPIYIGDVIAAFERAINSSYSGAINIAGDEVVSMRHLAKAIGDILKISPIFEETGEEAGDMMGDNTRMKEVLGSWLMVEMAEGLRRICEDKKELKVEHDNRTAGE